MSKKFDLKCIKGKTDIRWNKEKNDDEGFTYKVKIMVDGEQKIVLPYVPGRYMEEDGYIEDKDELNKSLEVDWQLQEKLINSRMESLFESLAEVIFTLEFYGAKLDGCISQLKKGKK